MRCPRCGETVPHDALFCVNCGLELRGYDEQTIQAPQAAQVRGDVRSSSSSKTLIMALATCCVALAAVAVVLAIRAFDDGGSSGEPADPGVSQGNDVVVVTSEPSASHAEESDSSDSNSPETTQGDESPEEEAQDEGAAPLVVRAALDEYSWEELAQVGDLISAAEDRSEALSIAEKYNLVLGQSKALNIGSLGAVRMRFVDVYHDVAETPSGRAGLSFVASSSSLRHRMAPKTIQEGGWEACEMRAYLRSDVWNALPSEVRDNVVSVSKISNNHGVTSDAGVCTATWDTLWLPSVMELAGEVDWTYHTHPELGAVYNAIFASEGTQYALFANAGIDCWNGNAILAVPEGTYWMRSISPSTARGRYVDVNGDPSCFDDANGERVVCFGFCL